MECSLNMTAVVSFYGMALIPPRRFFEAPLVSPIKTSNLPYIDAVNCIMLDP